MLYGGGTYGVRTNILTNTIFSFMEKFLWII